MILFAEPLVAGRLVKRYKRFLVDVITDDGKPVTAHCPNSGSMRSCLGESWPVRLSDSHNPERKYRLTLEMVHNGRCWIGVNTLHPNRLVREAICAGKIGELTGYDRVRSEVRYGDRSRIDLLLESDRESCYVEVKNVTLIDSQGRYAFPDAVTTRGRKHLVELQKVVEQGHRAVMLFVIQRSDGTCFTTADDIDPAYAAELRKALRVGVEVSAYRADVTPERIELTEAVRLADRIARFRLDSEA